MSDETLHLQLPYILPSQAQKHVTHNEAIRALDGLVMMSVTDRDLTAPPGDPAPGARYLVAAGASGDWEGWDDDIAHFVDGAWMRLSRRPGWRTWVEDERLLLVWNGAEWQEADGGLSLAALGDSTVKRVGVNTAADEANRLAVKADAVLFSHDDVTPGSGDMRMVLNKAAPGDTASHLFQTAYSGRAEFGLAGDDDLHLKTSADGADWQTAMTVAAASAVPGFPNGLRLGGGGDVLSGFAAGGFTPVLTFDTPGDLSVGYAVQEGRYWRIADMVVALVHIDATPVYSNATGRLRIGGLPITVASPMVANTFQHGSNTLYPAGSTSLVTRPAEGGDYFTCFGLGDGLATALNENHIPSGQNFVARALLVYRAAD